MKKYFLIVKSSALGDIIQTFPVVSYLKKLHPNCQIDWVVEESCSKLVSSHPQIDNAIVIESSRWKKNPFCFFTFRKNLRKVKYDLLFDLQGNCKSALITWAARADKKIGRGKKSVREWPNMLATTDRFEMDREKNMQGQYLSIVEGYFQIKGDIENRIDLLIEEEEKEKVEELLAHLSPNKKHILVCCGSNWENKRLDRGTLTSFLQKIEENLDLSFLLAWGNKKEKEEAKTLQAQLKGADLLPKFSFPTLQYLMKKIDYLIGVDSSLIHLCGTTQTPLYGIYGPTSKKAFNPSGTYQGGYQGNCPYKVSFFKQCPKLRSCSTGSCLKSISADELYHSFHHWYQNVTNKGISEKDRLTIVNNKN